ncbi:MAG: HAMP domain-containing histidine kinase [Thermoguttaceae bacterium]|nr:HAMP domain-containing histidine kinase [Thermoguttaceae bacterium]
MKVKQRNVLLLLLPMLLAGLLGLTGFLLWKQRENFEKVYLEEFRKEIHQEVDVILHFILPRLEASDWELLDEFCDTFAVGGRSIAFFNERGDAVIASGTADLRAVDKRLPEIVEAEKDGLGIHVRKDEQSENWCVFAAAIAKVKEHIPGTAETKERNMIFHLSIPNTSVSGVLRRANLLIALVLGGGALFVGLFSWHIFRTVYRPLNLLQQSAEKIAEGMLETQVPIPQKGAVRDLALSISSMAEQLRQEIDRVQQQEKLRREFIANVSHEIKTPLTGIMAVLQLLEEDGWEEEAQLARCREILSRQTRRMSQLVGDVLKVTRLEKLQEPDQEMTRNFQPVDLCQVVQAAVDLSWDTAQQAGMALTLTNSFPPGISSTISGDRTLLEQAVKNLILNAVKYSGSASVDVSLACREDQAVIAVRDYGIGIPQELSERIFERFFRIRRLDDTPNPEGSGLGLAIVRQTVLAHGGKVSLIPADGPGCCFEIRFPMKNET